MNGGQADIHRQLDDADLAILRCPNCGSQLAYAASTEVNSGEAAESPTLDCLGCEKEWPIDDGIAQLVEGDAVRPADKLLNLVYDVIAPFHDFGTAVALPLAQGVSDKTLRTRVLEHLELSTLAQRRGRPLRILEVGCGTGINWPIVEELLPMHLDAELWAVDLSSRMLRQTRRRAVRKVAGRLRAVRGDAHALPFADASFDRVFHVGAVATFGDPPLALAEMARVALPGTPIVVVDERLDPGNRQSLCRQALFKALTWYDRDPRAPSADELPPGAKSEIDQVSPFFYCMTFRVDGQKPNANRRSRAKKAAERNSRKGKRSRPVGRRESTRRATRKQSS